MNKKVLLLYSKDKMANSLRVGWLEKSFQSQGFEVELFNTTQFFSDYYQKRSKDTFWSWLRYHFRFLEPLCLVWPRYRWAKNYPFAAKLWERGRVISRLPIFKKSQVICNASPFEMTSLLFKSSYQTTIFDAHTCLADELKYSPRNFSESEISEIFKIEKDVLSKADIVTFPWYSVKRYFEKVKKLSFPNYVQADWGIEKATVKANYSKTPKIIYMGNMDDYWVNPDLLLSLINNSKYEIHLYGNPKNKKILNHPNYKGYLPDDSLDRLSEYQFGLLSLTRDELRSKTFSAKHLLYFSYGLPVLCPKWRKDRLLKAGTIYYEADNFDLVIKSHLAFEIWQEKQRGAIESVVNLVWDQQYKELVEKTWQLTGFEK